MLLPSIFGDDFFDDFMNLPFGGLSRRNDRRTPQPGLPALGMMHTDVKETDDNYLVRMDLPGFRREDVKAQLKDGYMTVTATREEKEEDGENSRYIRRERYMGTVTRSFYVGEALTEEDIKARFEDGTLLITLPKKVEKPQTEDRYITIDG